LTKLPQVSGRKAVRAFQRAGWEVSRQRGSHVVLTKPGSIVTLSVPMHDPVGRGLLHDLIRKAGLSDDDFLDLL
jgi:predicted RNA binding protein YcfA (HicA-like mRNA interferase family)